MVRRTNFAHTAALSDLAALLYTRVSIAFGSTLMTLKPPPIGDVIQQVNELVTPAGLADEVDRNARQLLQSALRRLDFVSREEFDAQAAILARSRSKIIALEAELAALTERIERLESGGHG